MRKLIVSINSTANGIVTGPPSDETNIGIWSQAGLDDLYEPFFTSLATVETILLGRATYDDLVRKWPKVNDWPDVSAIVLRIGEKINTTPKLVVTGTHPGERLEWGAFAPPARLTGADIETQITSLKAGDGGDIMTFGSPTLVQSLTNARLVDEYHISMYPVIMHQGKRLFENLDRQTDLRLINVETFEHGAMVVTYAPVDA